MPDKSEFVTPSELVKRYPWLKLGSLANDRLARRGFKYYKFGRRVLYKIEEAERLLAQNQVLTIDQRD